MAWGSLNWASIRQASDDFADQVSRLTSVEWAFLAITAASLFAWAWVMGGPKEQRPVAAGLAATGVIVLGCALGLASHLHRL